MIFNPPQDYIIPTIGYTQADLDAAVEAMRIETLEKAAQVCEELNKTWEIPFEAVDRCAAAIRSMK
jgi:hypothetical protein